MALNRRTSNQPAKSRGKGSTQNRPVQRGKRTKGKPTGPLKKELRKTAASSKAPPRRKHRSFTEKELAVPKLNMVTPAGVQKPKGKKKGKVFVDDPESMKTILAIVNAEKEGQIESKMIKARQMEEIREARRKEQEQKQAVRKEKFEEVKDSLRKKRRRRKQDDVQVPPEELIPDSSAIVSKKKKRVSFA